MKSISTSDAFCKLISARETKHRINGDESLRGSTLVHGRIFGIFEQKLKARKHIHNLKNTHSAFY